MRRTNLCNAQANNLVMHGDIKVKANHERKEFLKEKDNIQTSIKSKVLDEAQEKHRFNTRKHLTLEAKDVNLEQNFAVTCNNFAARRTQLNEEQR